ncbi:hypothetical protein ASG25_19895 [Rhizobium sp. Leaf384]|nr:hypothetical protein ASG25_19895 [Rhizobium sp. Leaf384]KQS75867.1 hypothetical protein ASG58_13575 [Rhizobium sp. Leaf383]
MLRVTDYTETAIPVSPDISRLLPKPPASLIAVKLMEQIEALQGPLAYIARSETAASSIVEAVRSLDPDFDVVFLPPWDCLPYDRISPSRQCMGRRMDAMRVWCQFSRPALFVTSLDAALQKIPPLSVVKSSFFELTTVARFPLDAFRNFVETTGYVEDSLVDEPGEVAFRADVIDIFPAGQSLPMRIHLDGEDGIAELRTYDPLTQRTVVTRESMVFGPASEAIPSGKTTGIEGTSSFSVTERGLFQLYGELQTVFDLLDGVPVILAPDLDARLETYLEIIRDARQAEEDLRGQRRASEASLYLDAVEWVDLLRAQPSSDLPFAADDVLPAFLSEPNPRRSVLTFLTDMRSSHTIVLAGTGKRFDGFCRRVERALGSDLGGIASWRDVVATKPGAVLKLETALDQGFLDAAAKRIVIAAADILGQTADSMTTRGLEEPDLTLGDVVVHEDHGIGILESLETVEIDGEQRDAARLAYHNGASLLVPMEEFGKLWRYGSTPEVVKLDRLHTDAWARKRAAIARDVRTAAKQLKTLARDHRAKVGAILVPPPGAYGKLCAAFPYSLTGDQAAAVDAVLADLASGSVMNRLICGDVGFGKTEIALRAAAAAALSGHQVVLVAPTTVLARQHFGAFQRRFAGSGLKVAMLSRVVDAKEAKAAKAGLAAGEIDIVVATHAVLASDVAFARLGLLIVDEEHRFGTRDKQALKTLAPQLHTLTMSATPIPRTLQAALVGLQEVSLLTTPPMRRRPVRTVLAPADRATMRVALMREHRRGGQSFVVAPQIEDLEGLQEMLADIVPELSLRVAHGKRPAAEMDEIMVAFAEGDGDVLLSTNIIESGLDVPNANTIFVWRADRFGLAQLHQLRGRVGRGKIQGAAYLLTAPDQEVTEETRRRLATLVENDRLGSGLAISFGDLDQRGGGDIAGEDQAGHMRAIGVSLYQMLLAWAVGGSKARGHRDLALNLGLSGSIPETSVSDATVRLNLHAKLARAATIAEIDDLADEYEDRFGDVPAEVTLLLRLARLKRRAGRLGITRIDAGPRAIALAFGKPPSKKLVAALSKRQTPSLREDRLIFECPTETALERLKICETLLAKVVAVRSSKRAGKAKTA